MTSTYRLAGLSASERLGNHPDTCSICGRESLVHAVKLVGDDEIVWAGTGCAANLLFGRTDKVAKAETRKLMKQAQDETISEERREAQRRSDEHFAAWKAFLDDAAGPGDTGEQIARLGGFAAARRLQDERKV